MYENPAEGGIEEPIEVIEIDDKSLSEEDLQAIITSEISSAVDFIDNTIGPERAKATKYYKGERFGNEEDGRSQIVSHDVSDTVSAIMPSLMRIFFSTDKVVEFVPKNADDVLRAEQATDYINHIFTQTNPGFSILHNCFKDSLVRKVGVIKYWWDEDVEVTTEHFSGLNPEALQFLSSDPLVEVTSQEIAVEMDEFGNPIGMPSIEATVTRRVDKGRVKVEAVPPEEFLIDRDAKTLEDATIVAHRTVLTVSDLVARGYDEEEILEHAGDTDVLNWSDELAARQETQSYGQATRSDDAAKDVSYTESYVKADMDGDGIAELIKVCSIGPSNKVLYWEPVADIPFATFCPDPEPHTFFGMSVADSVMDIQKTKSTVLRNMLDSLAMSIHPRTAIVEGQANIDDVLNTEVGAIIRMRSAGSVQPFAMPFVGKEAFPMMQYLDELRENRTGISKAAAGLDASALQSSTASAVQATVSQAQQHIEMIARIFAETGMKQLFKGILKLTVNHQDEERMTRLNNQFVPIDPRSWNADMDVSSNIALGKGTDTERIAALSQIAGKQEELMKLLGPVNALVSPKQYSHTLAKIVELSGFKDPSMFVNALQDGQPLVPPEAAQNKKKSAEELLAEVQAQSIQADIQKKAAELELKRDEMMRKDDLERDKLDVDIHMRAAEIESKNGATVNVAQIRADVDRDREMIKGIQAGRGVR
jgi:hypothetical protein